MAAMLDSKYRNRTGLVATLDLDPGSWVKCLKLCDQISPEFSGALRSC